MSVTIKDIAKDVGVNIATVSRALNDKPGVSPELRRQILKKASELKYLPHGQARGLVTQRTETAGLLFDADTSSILANPFYGEVLAGIESEFRRHQFSLMFASTVSEELGQSGRLPKFILEHRVDGVLVIGCVESSVINLLQDVGLPFLLIDYHLPNHPIDAVVVDNRGGGRLVTEYLVSAGHRSIGFVGGGPLDRGNFAERREGYQEALKSAGISIRPDLIEGGAVEGGYASATAVLARAPDVTALVACNDANAFAAMRAVQAKSLSIPEDISVAGFDDITASAESWPPLTTAAVDKRAMGKMAAQRLIQMTKGDATTTPHETVFPAHLVRRASVAAPRRSHI